MKRILFVLMAVAAIAMVGAFVGCEPQDEPDPDPKFNERRDPTQLTGDTYYPTPHPAPIKFPVGE